MYTYKVVMLRYNNTYKLFFLTICPSFIPTAQSLCHIFFFLEPLDCSCLCRKSIWYQSGSNPLCSAATGSLLPLHSFNFPILFLDFPCPFPWLRPNRKINPRPNKMINKTLSVPTTFIQEKTQVWFLLRHSLTDPIITPGVGL